MRQHGQLSLCRKNNLLKIAEQQHSAYKFELTYMSKKKKNNSLSAAADFQSLSQKSNFCFIRCHLSSGRLTLCHCIYINTMPGHQLLHNLISRTKVTYQNCTHYWWSLVHSCCCQLRSSGPAFQLSLPEDFLWRHRSWLPLPPCRPKSRTIYVFGVTLNDRGMGIGGSTSHHPILHRGFWGEFSHGFSEI